MAGRSAVAGAVALCVVAIASTSSAASAATTTFAYTGTVQDYTVPTGVTAITVTAVGGQGQSPFSIASGLGGHGAIVSATIPVTPGQTLLVYVGDNGSGALRFNGGGSGGIGQVYDGGNGGDASDVRTSSDLATRLVVAGGGGGAGAASPICPQVEPGGDGGSTSLPDFSGQSGTTPTHNDPAGGATVSGPGVGGEFDEGYAGHDGALGQGGAGGLALSGVGGGGGGGGYYGGGGGAGNPCVSGGGGGGSSFVVEGATGVSVGIDTTGVPRVTIEDGTSPYDVGLQSTFAVTSATVARSGRAVTVGATSLRFAGRVSAKATVTGAGKAFTVRAHARSVKAGRRVSVRLRLGPRARARIRAARRARHRVTARLTLTLRDDRGRVATRRRTVRLD